MNVYKIALIGDGGVGKTTFIRRHLSGDFEKRYIATIGTDVNILTYNTNYGTISFDVWDCAGQDKFKELQDGYYIEAHGAIIMFDHSSPNTLKNTPVWYNRFKRVATSSVVLCGSKSDIRNPVVRNKEITKMIGLLNIKYYPVSSKTKHNFDKPFIELARELSGQRDLIFISNDIGNENTDGMKLNLQDNQKEEQEATVL